MSLKQVLEIIDLLEYASIEESIVENYFLEKGADKQNLCFQHVKGEKGETTFIKIQIHGTDGHVRGGQAPTLGIIGRLGGIGARPGKIGFVSDADGAIAALACASKILELSRKGDKLKGDVIISTHLSPASPIIPHDPVPFMDSPITIETMNKHEVDERMDAILSADATKGNRVINRRGFAISPTVKNGYILRISEDLLDIMQAVTGRLPEVFAITQQDITPYGNDLYHLNSIMQPATATQAPVVGVAITSEVAVAGCATGANQFQDIEMAVRFMVEVAKAWGMGQCSLFNEQEYQRLLSLYGSLDRFKTLGRNE